jgi:mono/diheme cytochrome c family protein
MKFKSLVLLSFLSLLPGFCAAEEPAKPAAGGAYDLKASIERGRPLYMQTCVACHQPTGMGLPGAFPPLAKTEYVTGSPKRMVAAMLKGISGPLTVNGVTYNNVMIALDTQFPIYKDDGKVADVSNFVRNSFGNASDVAVTPEMVAEVRKMTADKTTPYTEAELKEWKD